MKRFVVTIVLACMLSGTVLAGEGRAVATNDGPGSINPGTALINLVVR